jgi:arylsulfatase A-like enzyme/Flp pilus assembly protein TadD
MGRSKVHLLMKSMGFSKLKILFFVVLAAAAAVVVWFLLPKSQAVHNVVLISLDTCRADHLSCYGFGRKTTPNIDAIAQEGVLFENAVSPMPMTLPAHSSMLTGTYPPYHKVHDNLNYRLDWSNVTVAEILREHGYTTGAIISSFILYPQFGISQGFDSFNNKFEEPMHSRTDVERRGGEASRLACEYLEEHRDEPFFLFLHYYDPHMRYDPPEPFASEYSDDLYSGEIAYTDYCVGQVIEKLKSLGLCDSTLLIIVGDHGEALGEHGEAEHGYFVYQSALKVPFIIRPPGPARSRRVTDVVSLVDVVPTILNYLGIEIPAHVQGRELSGYLNGKVSSDQKRYVYAESLIATKYDCNPLFGLVGEQWKYIETTGPELYDLTRDRREEDNLVEKETNRARLMRVQLRELIASLVSDKGVDSEIELDEESKRRLESLGYVGGGTVSTTLELDPKKPDPKDLIVYHEYGQRVTYLIFHKQYDEARSVCEKMLAEWPKVRSTHFRLARLSRIEGNMAKVLEHGAEYLAVMEGTVDRSLEASGLSPTKKLAKTNEMMGEAAYELGKFDLAIKHWTEALRLKPDWAEMHNNLAIVFGKQGDVDRAIDHLTKALRLHPTITDASTELKKLMLQKRRNEIMAECEARVKEDPSDADMRDKLAKFFYLQGKIDEAIEHWKEVVRLKPDWAEAHNDLATAFYRQDKNEQAVKHWAEAVRLKSDWAEACNNLAWILATVEDEKLRDPAEAVQLAERACELSGYKQPGMLDTLGAAYAAVGRFTEAVETAEKAIELALEAGQDKLVEDIRSHLELYKMNEPYSD